MNGKHKIGSVDLVNSIINFAMTCLLPVLFASCVDHFNPHLTKSDSESLLVVEGQITDEVGPFRVRLTTSVPVTLSYNYEPVLNAIVKIVDNNGKTYQLTGDNTGLYQSAEKDLKGIPGNTYTLYITTQDSIEYFSSPVLMQEVPAIDTLYFEQTKYLRFDQNKAVDDSLINIYLNTHDPNEKIKYWRFEFIETWQVDMTKDRIYVEGPGGRGNYKNWHWMIYDSTKVCWVTQNSASILITSTLNNPVDEIKRFRIESLYAGSKLHIRYSVLVKQYSLNKELYDYWKRMIVTNESTEGIYGRLPSPVYGNIICSDGEKKALGYFTASAVTEKRLFISRSEHHLETFSVNHWCDYDYGESHQFFGYLKDPSTGGIGSPVYTNDRYCWDCGTFGTKIKPSYW